MGRPPPTLRPPPELENSFFLDRPFFPDKGALALWESTGGWAGASCGHIQNDFGASKAPAGLDLVHFNVPYPGI